MIRTGQIQGSFDLKRLEYFSDWYHAKRAIAVCLRLKDILQTKSQPTNSMVLRAQRKKEYQPIQVDDLQGSEKEIICMVQMESFPEEMKVLEGIQVRKSLIDRKEANKRNHAIKETSTLFRLDPFLDEKGIIRVDGRFKTIHLLKKYQEPHDSA